jgi:hypothetical protein
MIKYYLMRHIMICTLAIPLALCAVPGQAGDIDVNFHFGIPQPPIYVAPRPVHRPPAPTFYFQDNPELIYMDSLGFYVAVGSPYDLFRHDNYFYIYQQGYWHRSSHLNGPWRIVEYRSLPSSFRRHKIEQIRRYRDAEYDRHRHHRRSGPDKRYHPPRYQNDREWDHRDRDHRDGRYDRYDRRDERRW